MSASREKKQRQAGGPSEKTLQAQQEQTARKRKTITYTVIGVVVAVLVAALLIWNTGVFTAGTTAATVGGENLSVAELSYYYHNAYNAWMNENYLYYYYLGYEIPGENDVMDSETGKTYRDYFMEQALRSAQRSAALADEAKKNGHTEAEVKESLDAQIQSLKTRAASSNISYSAYLKVMYGSYMSAGVFEKLYTQGLLADLVYSEKHDELYDGYSEADLRAYYEAENHADSMDTFEYSYLYFAPADVPEEDEKGNELDKDTVAALEKEALAEAKAKAEEALKALKGGGSISSQADKYELTDNRFGNHVSVVGITSAPFTLRDKLLSMKAGGTELVEDGESGYYVVTLHGRKLAEDPTKDVRHILALAETTVDDGGNVVPPTNEAWAAAKAEIEAIRAEYESGARTEDSFAALANEKSDDGDGTTGGLYPKIDRNDKYVPEFLEWIFADGRKAGDTGIVQHDPGDTDNGYWGYHFMYLVGDNEPVWMRNTRDALTSEDLSAWTDELAAGYETTLTSGAKNVTL